jgi:hypothetical protein
MVGAMLDGFHNHLGDLYAAQMKRACSGPIQQSVHGQERVAGGQWVDKGSMRGQTAVKTPSEKNRPADHVKMW